ncbi:MAG: GNAT family N-acetyltransferase [Acidobacteriota bacterium]
MTADPRRRSSDPIELRTVVDDDLSAFFEHQLDPDARHMAAFTTKDATDRRAFDESWARILADPTVTPRTIVGGGCTLGHILSYESIDGPEPRTEVSYWIGREFWGRSVATRALRAFLESVEIRRPVYARVAEDNLGSRKVLENCGFRRVGVGEGYAAARDETITELVYRRGGA